MTNNHQTNTSAAEQSAPQADEFVIRDLETMRIIAEPIRMRLLELLVLEPQPVKRLAKTLKLAQTKLYYHINLLEQHGLIQVVSTQIVSGIIEKQYGATARSYRIDKALLALRSPEEVHPIQAMLDALLEGVGNDLRQSLAAGLIDPAETAPPERRIMLGRVLLRLTPERANALHQRLEALIKEFVAPSDQEPTPLSVTRTFHLFVACFPTETRSRDDDQE